MDAQLFWDPLGSSSCWHGVTSVVMGNCGFTLAPSRSGQEKLVMDNLERAEDIPPESMVAGIDWSWESFPEYLDAVEAQPKAINYASQIGHSALRTFAMGERAFTEEASEDDLELMSATLREALRAGAIGFSTSMSGNHVTPEGRPVASRIASWDEISRLVEVVGAEGGDVFEISLDTSLTENEDPAIAKTFYDRLRDLAVATRVPTTYGLRRVNLQLQLDTFEETAAAGGKIFGQCTSNLLDRVYCFKTRMPYDRLEEWVPFRSLPLEEQLTRLRDPEVRADLVKAVHEAYQRPYPAYIGGEPNPSFPDFEVLRVMREGKADVSAATLARERGVDPVELIIDLGLETNFEQTFTRFTTSSEDEVLLAAMQHPRTIMTFGDAGAHVLFRSGADLQTTLLSLWVRQRQLFTLEEAIRMITLAPALAWNLSSRGLLSEGMIADVNVFDPETIAPGTPVIVNDLPAGARRVRQRAAGLRHTIVAGQETFRDGEHTGAYPGGLIRG